MVNRYILYEDYAQSFVNDIKNECVYEYNFQNEIEIKKLEKLVCLQLILRDIHYMNAWRNTWLALILIALVILLIKIW